MHVLSFQAGGFSPSANKQPHTRKSEADDKHSNCEANKFAKPATQEATSYQRA